VESHVFRHLSVEPKLAFGIYPTAAFADGNPWKKEESKLNKTIEMILFIFIYLPFTFTVTLTFWPGFNPVTVAFAEFLVVDVAGFLITAFEGTFAAAAFAAVATLAATDAFATALVAAAVFVAASVLI
jgi:hypothetical protein